MTTSIDSLLNELTLEEKVSLLSGSDTWRTAPIDRLAVPAIKVSDGPNGVRGDSTTGARAVCVPASIALGASFDVGLVAKIGQLLGRETARKGAHVLLAPTINIARHPLGGRNFESFGEDPTLTSAMAVAYVEGVQSEEGVGACAKHFVANDVEYRRMTVSSEVDERTLREVYLAPFEAVVEAGVWSLMASYPKLNGQHCTEHHWLLTELLRDEWGFDGVVMSDWGATHHPARPIAAGLDLEMPGPPRALGDATLAALASGELAEDDVDLRVRRVLELAVRSGRLTLATEEMPLSSVMEEAAEQSVDLDHERSLTRRAATSGMVLIRNAEVAGRDGVSIPALPLDPAQIQHVAVIGPNADPGVIQGGGSAELPAHDVITPLEGLEELFAEVTHAPGVLAHRYLPLIPIEAWEANEGQPPLRLEIFGNTELEGAPIVDRRTGRLSGMAHNEVNEADDPLIWSRRWTGTLQITAAGTHQFGCFAVGRSRIMINGELVVDNWTEKASGDGFFQMASSEVVGSVELEEGPAEVVVEWATELGHLLVGVRVGWLAPVDEDAMLDAAVDAATKADAAVLVVGLNADWETESHDRPLFGLPGRQDELIRRVAAANPRTVVCVNAGGPVDLPWLDDVPATLFTWYPGQEFGSALADVLTGSADPGGRLPVTFPRDLADAPTHGFVPGEGDTLHYGEGVLVGHRWYDTQGTEPRVPFGAGLSYASFNFGVPEISAAVAGSPPVVSVPVSNVSERSGRCVLQLYAESVESVPGRPMKVLAGFAAVDVGPGEEVAVDLTLDDRALRVWGDEGWIHPAGAYRLQVGTSSRDMIGEVEFIR